MESPLFDNVKFEKEKAIARFNRFRRMVKLWQIVEVAVVFGLISWCAPAVVKVAGGYFVELSTFLFNHHVVFLIGNAIIGLLLTLCRENDVSLSGGRDFYDEYVKYSEAEAAAATAAAAVRRDSDTVKEEAGGGDCEKQIVVRAEEMKPVAQCDDVAEAIEKATKQIQRFQRTQSEILKREITVRQRPELRRSETASLRKSDCADATEIETLSNEEFQRRIEAFIDEHWSKRTPKRNQLKGFGNFQLGFSEIAASVQ